MLYRFAFFYGCYDLGNLFLGKREASTCAAIVQRLWSRRVVRMHPTHDRIIITIDLYGPLGCIPLLTTDHI
jgi:hypothetical protein